MRQSNFNIVHLAIALLCVIVIATIVVIVLDASRRGPRITTDTSQLRGIHQGLVIYANSNKDYFVGLNSDGTADDLSVESRFHYLIENDFFTPEYAISPWEDAASKVHAWDQKSSFTANHYSYAMLQIPEEGGRREEWRTTLNTQAIVLSSRNTGTATHSSSIHVEPGDPWAGSVLWNDNIAVFENGGDIFETRYGGGEINEADRLFESSGKDDAFLIHSGN